MNLFTLITLFALPFANCACSPAENKCGELCCCVTCTCLEDPYRCEDMWGKSTDHVGRHDDERWSDPAWLEEHHRKQMEIANEHRERHMTKMREMEDNMPTERRDKMKRRRSRRMKRGKEGKHMGDEEDEEEKDLDIPDLDGLLGDHNPRSRNRNRDHMDDEDDEDMPNKDIDHKASVSEMRKRMHKRMQDSKRKHMPQGSADELDEEVPEDGEDVPEEDAAPRGGKFKKGWKWEEEQEAEELKSDL